MIELKNIYKSFGSLEVLRNVSATINNGEVVSIVGPSGAGKTTLLQIAGSLDKADSGNMLIATCSMTESAFVFVLYSSG